MSQKVEIDIQDDEKEREQAAEEASNLDQAGETETGSGEPQVDGNDLEAKLKAAEQKADAYYDRLLRASAEFDNYKKRTTREMQDVVRYANEKMLKELLTVVDNLERAIESAQQESAQKDPLLEGVRLTLSGIEKIFERHHVKPITALGEPFDPNFHQAMMQEERADEPDNTVVLEMQRGYMLHDRLLRPAMVVVSKAKNKEG